jgi:hypothetical protein
MTMQTQDHNTATNNAADAVADEQIIDGKIVEIKPDNALVVMDPAKYATELFASFNEELAVAKRKSARIKYDIATTEGMDSAKSLRNTFVKIRTRADKAKTEAKRPIDLAGKEILARFALLKAAAEAEEAKHNLAITAQEEKIEAEKQAKIEAQRVRTEEIQNRIAHIRGIPAMLVQSSSAAVGDKLAELSEKRLEPAMYDDHLEDAINALNSTIDQLRAMVQTALAREETARQAEADRVELDRLRNEKAEADRKAAADQAAQAEALAAMQRQQQQMTEIMAIQGMGSTAGDRFIVDAALATVRAFTPESYGDLQPMAAMARDMATMKLEATLAALPAPIMVSVAAPSPSLSVTHYQEVVTILTDLASVVRAPAAQQEPVDLGPTDDEIVDLVADAYSWTHEATRARLAKIPY